MKLPKKVLGAIGTGMIAASVVAYSLFGPRGYDSVRQYGELKHCPLPSDATVCGYVTKEITHVNFFGQDTITVDTYIDQDFGGTVDSFERNIYPKFDRTRYEFINANPLESGFQVHRPGSFQAEVMDSTGNFITITPRKRGIVFNSVYGLQGIMTTEEERTLQQEFDEIVNSLPPTDPYRNQRTIEELKN